MACANRVRVAPTDHRAQACWREAAVRAGEGDALVATLEAQAAAPGASPLAQYFLARAQLLLDPRKVPPLLSGCAPAASRWCAFAAALHGEQVEGPGVADAALPPQDAEVEAARVRWALAAQDWARARSLADALEAGPKTFAESPHRFVTRARIAVLDGRWAEARAAAAEAAARAPDSADAPALDARVALALGDGAGGLDALRAAVAAAPGDDRLRGAWARLLISEGRVSAAVTQFQWLVDRRPEVVDHLVGLGRALLATGDGARAATWADLALARAPEHPEATLVKAEALLVQGELAAFLALRPKLLAPDAPADRRVELGTLLARHGHDELAAATLAEATTHDPGSAPAWLAHARFVERRLGPLRALRLLDSAVNGPAAELAAVWAEVGRLRAGLGDHGAAREAFKRSLELAPDEPDPADELARLRLEAGDRAGAIAAWTALLEVHPLAHRARVRLSLALRAALRPAEAVPHLRTLAEHRPRDGAVQLMLGETLLALDAHAEALEALRAAQTLGAEPERLDPLLAAAHLALGNTAEARAALERAVARQPDNRAARLSLARLLEGAGESAAARLAYEALLARDALDLEAQAGEVRLAALRSGDPDAPPSPWPAAAKDATLAALAANLSANDGREATVLRDEREVVLDADGIAAIRHVRSVLVHRREAVDRLRTTQVSFHAGHPPTVVRARTLTPDGAELAVRADDRIERNPHAGTALFGDARALELRFEGVEPGAIIDSEVITHRPHPDLKDTWWDGYILANIDPTVRARYALQVPDKTRFSARAPGMGAPEELRESGQRRVTWTRTDLPAHPLRGPEAADAAAVYVSSLTDWRAVDRWYQALFAPQAAVTPAVRERAAHLTRGLKTRREKIAAIYRFVEREVRYLGLEFGIGAYQPRSAEHTLRLGRGDCKDMTALMVGLLAAVDIVARPALIRPRGQGVFIEAHPSPGQFSHVVLYVPDSKGDLWLDATSGMGTLDAVPTSLRGRRALVVDGRGGRLVTVPEGQPKAHRVEQVLDYELTATGGGRLTVTARMVGDLAGQARQKLLPLADDARRALLAGPGGVMPGSRAPDVVLTEGIEHATQPLVLTATLDHPDLVGVRLDGTLVLPALDLRFLMEGPLPLLGGAPLLGGPRTLVRELRVRPPAGHRFVHPPIDWRSPPGPAQLVVTEVRGADQTRITARLVLARSAADDETRLALLMTLKRAEAELTGAVAMAPGPDFDALAFITAMAAEQPEDAALQIHLGRTLLEARQWAPAAEALGRAVALGSEEPRALALWAAALMRTADPGRAVVPLDRLAQREDADVAVHRMLASLLAELDRWPEARQALDRAAARFPDDDGLRRLQQLATARAGDVGAALQAAEAEATRRPTDVDAQRALGDVAQQAGQPARAERAYRAALKIQPNQPRVLNNLAWLLHTDPGRRAEARELVDQALALDPTADAAWDTLAELQLLDGDAKAARRAWQEALRHAPSRSARYQDRLRALDRPAPAPATP